MHHHINRAIGVLVTLACFVIIAAAQFNTGSITGVVHDSSGAVIANATVKITNIGTNETKTVQTDSEGRYEVPVLPTGRYNVEASSASFSPQLIKDVPLAVGQKARVDLSLTAGAVSATITVNAEQTITDTEKSSIGGTVTQSQVADLPINGRDFTQLLATVPGSVQTSNFFQTSLNGVPSWFGQSVLVDGIDAGRGDLNGFSNTLGRVDARINRISVESIQEVQVVEQTYSAEYGQALGAIINPITKSGANDMHGGLFEYFRNDKLDANDWFDNARNLGKQKFRLNQFGGSLSGAIVKEKLFYFVDYEGVRQRTGTVLSGYVPTAAFRTQIAAALAPVVAKYPLPNGAAYGPDPRLALFTKQGTRQLREDTGSIKLDYKLRENDHLSFRYNVNDSNTITPYGVSAGQIAPASLRVQLFKATETHTFSANAINELAFGLNRNVTNPRGGDQTIPTFNFSFIDAAIAGPGPAAFAQFRTTSSPQILDTFSLVRGNHSLKFGTDIRLNRRSAEVDQQDSLIYFGLNDFRDNSAFVAQRAGFPLLHYANENYSFFGQDDWKITPRLTLNLGLRYDVSSTSREKNGQLQNFILATQSFTKIGDQITNPDKNNLGPRLGFAYDVFGDTKTVLRGGFGIFFNQELPASFGSPQNDTFPNLSVNLFDTLFGCGKLITFPIDSTIFQCGGLTSRQINAIDPNLKTPYAEQWSLNMQRDLGIGVLQVGYVGNHVLKLTAGSSITAINFNRADIVTGVRPIPTLGDIFLIGDYPQSNYNSLQASFKRHLTKGLQFNINYTWAHEIDDAVAFLKDYQDENNPNAERSSGDADVRHNLEFDFTYDIPSLKRWFSGAPTFLSDGWQINSLTQIRSGLPVTATVTGGLFGGAQRPNVVPGVSTVPANYSLPFNQFNSAAFSDPGAGHFGNLGRNTLRGPGFWQADFSIFKSTKINDHATVQFRMEMFNIFNHVNFADPFGGLNKDPITNTLNPSGTFGQSFQTVGDMLGGLLGPGGPRQVQMAVRISF